MAKNPDLKDLIKDFLGENSVLALATSRSEKPWIANVFYVVDENLNFYFLSGKETRHSQEGRQNPNIAVAIYGHGSKPGGVRGVQIEGMISELDGNEVAEKFALYLQKFPETKQFVSEVKLLQDPNFGARLYRIKPSKIFYLDEERFGQERKELIL